MDYSDINSKWKQFLNENTFKEDKIIDPKKKKKRKKDKEDGRKEVITNEWEEFQHQEQEEQMDEYVLPDGGTQGTPKSDYNDAIDAVEEEQLEEMSTMSGGDVAGHAGGKKGPWISKKEFNKRWS